MASHALATTDTDFRWRSSVTPFGLPSVLSELSRCRRSLGSAGHYRLLRNHSTVVSDLRPEYARALRRHRGRMGDTWYLDELFVNSQGTWVPTTGFGPTGEVSPDLRTSLIVDPPDGRFPLTEETRERIAAQREYRRAHPANSWLDRSNWDRCITYHGMLPISTGYNNTYQIFQAPGYVAILVENIHDVRIIPVDGRRRLDDDIRQWNGDSRGH